MFFISHILLIYNVFRVFGQTLYITTAREGLNENDLKEYPLSGGLFVVKPGVKGIKANLFRD
jgi:sugar lactone lactonase YvrE